jgi:hypothetical protein
MKKAKKARIQNGIFLNGDFGVVSHGFLKFLYLHNQHEEVHPSVSLDIGGCLKKDIAINMPVIIELYTMAGKRLWTRIEPDGIVINAAA